MDLFDIVAAKKLPGGGGGGGNPNQKQVVTGTAANPFGDVDVSELKSAMMAGGASATIFMDTSQLVGSSYTIPFDTPTSATSFLAVSNAYVDTAFDSVNAVRGVWKDDGSVYVLDAFTNGHAVDAEEYASMIPTVLTIIWHPLP